MSRVPQEPADDHGTYYEQVRSLDRATDAELASIRRKEDVGEYTPVESAEARTAILEAHLKSLEELRQRYLGDS